MSGIVQTVRNIEYVELQANVGLGLDDVVVTYSDGRRCI